MTQSGALSAVQRGRLVHELIDQAFRLHQGDLRAVFDQAHHPDVRACLTNAARSAAYRKLLSADEVRTEESLVYGTDFVGRIDAVAFKATRALLVDWKTGREETDSKLQLVAYALVLLRGRADTVVAVEQPIGETRRPRVQVWNRSHLPSLDAQLNVALPRQRVRPA